MATKATKGNTTQAAPTKDEVAQQVTQLRLAGNSWAAIGQQLGFAPRTARAYFQRANGAHSHHGTLPGKGGRLPVGYVAPTAEATKAPGTTPWVPGQGQGVPGTLGGAIPAQPTKAAPRRRATKRAAK